MKNWFNIGMGSGLLIGLLVFFFTSRQKKNEKVIQWDERQIALRGECYRIGFFVVVISSIHHLINLIHNRLQQLKQRQIMKMMSYLIKISLLIS